MHVLSGISKACRVGDKPDDHEVLPQPIPLRIGGHRPQPLAVKDTTRSTSIPYSLWRIKASCLYSGCRRIVPWGGDVLQSLFKVAFFVLIPCCVTRLTRTSQQILVRLTQIQFQSIQLFPKWVKLNTTQKGLPRPKPRPCTTPASNLAAKRFVRRHALGHSASSLPRHPSCRAVPFSFNTI